MPTGIPIHDLPEQLAAAAERVLVRDGADALTSRAVTAEAGVAKGILHRHFADFDAFLVALVLARLERLEQRGAELRAAAGADTVVDNLAAGLAWMLDRETLAIVALVISRRQLLERLRLITPHGVPLLAQLTRQIGAYLTAERGLGRLPIEADVERLAVLLVGGGQLWCAGREHGDDDAGGLRELIATVLPEAAVGRAARGAGGAQMRPESRR